MRGLAGMLEAPDRAEYAATSERRGDGVAR